MVFKLAEKQLNNGMFVHVKFHQNTRRSILILAICSEIDDYMEIILVRKLLIKPDRVRVFEGNILSTVRKFNTKIKFKGLLVEPPTFCSN